MNKVKAVFLDISGVLYDGNEVIPGAIMAVESLRKRGLLLRFVTNTATQSQHQIQQKLTDMGFAVELDEIYTAPIAARDYLVQAGLSPFSLVHPSIAPMFGEMETDQPSAVLIGDARDKFDYEHLNRAFQLCRKGAPLIAIAKNRYFKEGGQLQLDSGAFVQAIEWASGVEALVMGKPAKAFFDQVVASTGFAAKDCVMVGDDVESDVAGAVKAGLQGVLVQTGKFTQSDLSRLSPSACCIASIAELGTLI